MRTSSLDAALSQSKLTQPESTILPLLNEFKGFRLANRSPEELQQRKLRYSSNFPEQAALHQEYDLFTFRQRSVDRVRNKYLASNLQENEKACFNQVNSHRPKPKKKIIPATYREESGGINDYTSIFQIRSNQRPEIYENDELNFRYVSRLPKRSIIEKKFSENECVYFNVKGRYTLLPLNPFIDTRHAKKKFMQMKSTKTIEEDKQELTDPVRSSKRKNRYNVGKIGENQPVAFYSLTKDRDNVKNSNFVGKLEDNQAIAFYIATRTGDNSGKKTKTKILQEEEGFSGE